LAFGRGSRPLPTSSCSIEWMVSSLIVVTDRPAIVIVRVDQSALVKSVPRTVPVPIDVEDELYSESCWV
jgi:hypothetical protein